ncbi:MAG: helix-turn-helix domain-containing protein [bacterium]|nr:helix-turn-helix domain-containing protein [bacterium]
MLEKYLEEIGLTDKEAVIYLYLLSVDDSAVLDIAKKTKINRSTVYFTLEGLMKKGLVSETQIGKKVHYQAEAPERLETYVERRKVSLTEQSKRLKEIIPQLKGTQRKSGERPIVKYFEGREGIVSSSEEFFRDEETKTGDIVYLIYPRDILEKFFSPEEMLKYKKMRLGKELRSKSVYTYSAGSLTDNTGDRVKIDQDKYPIKCDINVYKDKIRINTLGKNLAGFFIKSQDLADTLKSLINLIHDLSKK